tara:strand:- start:2578 stop:2745 length:168 start_codon:yes stop_codon:yes gene_type:complete
MSKHITSIYGSLGRKIFKRSQKMAADAKEASSFALDFIVCTSCGYWTVIIEERHE